MFRLSFFTLFFMVLVIWSMGALYFKKEDISWLTAYKISLGKFIDWFITPQKPNNEYNPNGDFVLGNKLRTALAKFDVRPAEYIACFPCCYSKYNLPCICLDFIPKNGENDFPAVKATMKSVFSEHMQKCGIYLYYCEVFIEPQGDSQYIIYIVYATTEQTAKAFQSFYDFQSKSMRKKAIDTVHPVIDDELEKELEGMENNEEHEN